MSYTPTNWQTGDTITAEKLNHIEQGLFEAVDSIIILNDKVEPFIVTLTPTAQDYSGTMDKTPGEIDEACRAGRRIRFRVMGMNAEVDATQYVDNTDDPEYYQAVANVIYNGMLVQIITSRLDQTYRTAVYPLTPMS